MDLPTNPHESHTSPTGRQFTVREVEVLNELGKYDRKKSMWTSPTRVTIKYEDNKEKVAITFDRNDTPRKKEEPEIPEGNRTDLDRLLETFP